MNAKIANEALHYSTCKECNLFSNAGLVEQEKNNGNKHYHTRTDTETKTNTYKNAQIKYMGAGRISCQVKFADVHFTVGNFAETPEFCVVNFADTPKKC